MATFSVPMYAYPNGDTYIIVEGFERPCELYLIEQNHGALKKEYFQSKSSDEAIGTLEIEIDNNGRIETAYPAKRVFFKDVIDNQLTTLHESVCQRTKLTTLDLSKNKLTTLPESIGNLVKLWWMGTISISVGQVLNLNTEWCGKTTVKTIHYADRQQVIWEATEHESHDHARIDREKDYPAYEGGRLFNTDTSNHKWSEGSIEERTTYLRP